MLRLREVTAAYQGRPALRRCSVDIGGGRLVLLLGDDSPAKSALLHTVARSLRQRSGSVEWEGAVIDRWTPDQAARAGIALVPAGRRLFPAMSVAENLRAGAARLPRSAEREAVDQALALMPELAPRMNLPAATLSGGEQQMLTMARALVGRPRLLLVDQMSLGLAPLVVRRLFATLRTAVNAGITAVVVEEHPAVALAAADEVVILADGAVALHGTPAELGNRAVDASAPWLATLVPA